MKKTLILLMPIFQISCMNQESQLGCLNKIITENRTTQIYKYTFKSLNDTIRSWNHKKLKYFNNSDLANWRQGDMIFNADKSKILTWILIKKSKTERFDWIQLISGEMVERKWNFYVVTMPSIPVVKSIVITNTFKDLSIIVKKELVTGGIIKNCEINNIYINQWMDEKKSKIRHKHYEFLKSSSLYSDKTPTDLPPLP